MMISARLVTVSPQPKHAEADVPRHASAILPTEVWGYVAEQLTPQNFVAMTSTCRTFRSLRHVETITRAISHQNPLATPTAEEGFRDPRARSWPEVLGSARLMNALARGAVGQKSFLAGARALDRELSPNSLHALIGAERRPEREDCHVYSFMDPTCGPLRFNAEHPDFYAKFTPSGRHLIVCESPSSAIKLFDLSDYGKPPRCIAPPAAYTYDQALDLYDGLSFIVSCSDRRLRTFTYVPQHDRFDQSGVFELGRAASLIEVSRRGNIYVLEEDDKLHIYHNNSSSSLKWLGELEFPCCGGVNVSPHGRFIQSYSDCDYPWFKYGIDVKKLPPDAIYDLDDEYFPSLRPGPMHQEKLHDSIVAPSLEETQEELSPEERAIMENDRGWMDSFSRYLLHPYNLTVSVQEKRINLDIYWYGSNFKEKELDRLSYFR